MKVIELFENTGITYWLDGVPVIKQGKHLFVYRDELDKWLETGRKSQVPLSFEEEHEQMLAATRHKAKPREL